jgi:ketosteroid isomerase-like protein
VVVLAAAVVGLGACAIAGEGDGESDAQALWDETLAAWSRYDRDAVESLYAPDAQLRTISGGTRGVATFSGNEAIGASVAFFELESLSVSRSSDVAAQGEFAASFGTSTTAPEMAPETILSVVQIRDGKIVRQWSFWPFGAGAPFENVLVDE